ncbi:cytochrome b [Parerythrobacter aestuarii]|uniref:cytochrome b n=1 Tax=Parerythrobacter aestuarii TaxID=3020909 RepID=UPI0024DED597|nr:cytochrome b [Parerythrobacter aestuarii]
MTAIGRSKYSGVAMIFHWVIAIAVIVNWRIAEAAEHGATDAEKGAIMANHKALGITILVLTLARLAWRLKQKVPPLPDSYKAWEKAVARGLHILFYVLLIGLPLGGWLGSSFYGRGIEWFGMFSIPALPVGENFETGKAILELHHTGGSIFIYLIALHILAALKHQFLDKEGGITRMLPFGRA